MCAAHLDSPRIELTSQTNALAARIETTQRLLEQVSISASILSSEASANFAIISDIVRVQLKCLAKYQESKELKFSSLGFYSEKLVERMGEVYWEKLSLILQEDAPSREAFIEKWKEKTIEHLIIPKIRSKDEIDKYISVLRNKLNRYPPKDQFHVTQLSEEAAIQARYKKLEKLKKRLEDEGKVRNVFEAAQAGDLLFLQNARPKAWIHKERKYREFANQKDSRSFALLHIATYAGRLEVVRFLIESGADIEVEDEFRNRPLHWAAAIGATEIARTLLERGADINAHGANDWTPLHRSVFKNHVEVTQLLLDYGADRNLYALGDSPPIREVIPQNNFNMVRLLLREGAKVTERDLEIAEMDPHPGIIAMLRKRLGKKQAGVDRLPLLSSKELLEEGGEKLGEGGNAHVLKGILNGRHVAVKLHQFNGDPSSETGKYIREEMEAEAVMMSELDHPNVLHFIGLLEDRLGFVVELIANGELYEMIPTVVKHEWDWGQLMNFGKQMAEGLAYLHSKQIIHRDLKSPNILVNEENQPVIADFGISKVQNHDLVHTQALGSPFWMAPEQITTTNYSYPIDIYALGMILWEIFSGKHPFEELNHPMQAIRKILEEQPGETIDQAYTPPILASLLEKCWLDADSRPTAADIVDIFNQINDEDLEGFIRPFPLEQGDVDENELLT